MFLVCVCVCTVCKKFEMTVCRVNQVCVCVGCVFAMCVCAV